VGAVQAGECLEARGLCQQRGQQLKMDVCPTQKGYVTQVSPQRPSGTSSSFRVHRSVTKSVSLLNSTPARTPHSERKANSSAVRRRHHRMPSHVALAFPITGRVRGKTAAPKTQASATAAGAAAQPAATSGNARDGYKGRVAVASVRRRRAATAQQPFLPYRSVAQAPATSTTRRPNSVHPAAIPKRMPPSQHAKATEMP